MHLSIKDKIEERVERDRAEIVGFLQKLIQFDSETGKELKIQQFIAEFLRQMDVEVDAFTPDLERLKGQPGYVPIIFL